MDWQSPHNRSYRLRATCGITLSVREFGGYDRASAVAAAARWREIRQRRAVDPPATVSASRR
ncbi:hypothetical protein [Embleya sp. NPDC005575]|uniref:hypothetical protein n=1 Tax=Embleya sp. NPDC005575 TaxID=3156892 RepID=UPI0033B872D5